MSANAYPPVKIELAPPQDGDLCAYVANPLPKAFVSAIHHACMVEIESWICLNAPSHIRELLSAQYATGEYCQRLESGQQVQAFLHTDVLSKIPTALCKLSRRITFEVDGALHGGDE